MTRHPKLGAAERRPALYRNHREISGLEFFGRSEAPEVPMRELVEKKRRRQSAGVTASFVESELEAHP